MKKLMAILLAALLAASIAGCSGSNNNGDNAAATPEQTENKVTDGDKDDNKDEDKNEEDDKSAVAGERNFGTNSSNFRDFITNCRVQVSDAASELLEYYDADFYASEAASYYISRSSFALDLACERVFSGEVDELISDMDSYIYVTVTEYNVDDAAGTAIIKGTNYGEDVVVTVEYDGSSTAQCIVRNADGDIIWYVSYMECDDYVAYSYAVEAITTIDIKFSNGDNLFVFDRTNPLGEPYTVYNNDTITTSYLTENNLYCGLVDGVFVNKSE